MAEVHTVQQEGSLLVVEYLGYIFPIFTRNFKDEAAPLSRQDFVKIHYKIQESPHKPMHLELETGINGKAIELIDSVHEQHGKMQTLRGALVLFPQSPTIKFNVFAVKVDAGYGLTRTYTLINFQDMALFTAIREKLQRIWDDGNAECRFNDRNKLTNPCIEIEVTGATNHQDPNQANPQILLNDLGDIKGPWAVTAPMRNLE